MLPVTVSRLIWSTFFYNSNNVAPLTPGGMILNFFFPSLFSIFEFQIKFVMEMCSHLAMQMRWHKLHRGNRSLRHRSLLFASSKVNWCVLFINISEGSLGNCALPEDGPCVLLLVGKCSLSLNRGMIHAIKTESTRGVTQKSTSLSQKFECLKIWFLSCTGNKQSQYHLWEQEVNRITWRVPCYLPCP